MEHEVSNEVFFQVFMFVSIFNVELIHSLIVFIAKSCIQGHGWLGAYRRKLGARCWVHPRQGFTVIHQGTHIYTHTLNDTLLAIFGNAN